MWLCAVRKLVHGVYVVYSLLRAPETWNRGLGLVMLIFRILKPLGLQDSHIPTFWLLLHRRRAHIEDTSLKEGPPPLPC